MNPHLNERLNKLPKWARDYIHNVHTFVGAEEVEELTFLRDQNRQLIKLVGELKAENRRLQKARGTKGEQFVIMTGVDDPPLTEDELKQLRQNLARLSQSSVENEYREAYRQCELKGDRLPKPVALQQLVQCWRQLWIWRKRR